MIDMRKVDDQLHEEDVLTNEDREFVRELIENEYYYRRELYDKMKDPRRDIYEDCGYLETNDLTPEKMLDQYQRNPFATRVVDLPVDESWRRQPTVESVKEDSDTEESEFDVAWRELDRILRGDFSWYHSEEGSPVWEYLKRIDRLSRIGQYGVLMLEFDDVGKEKENGEVITWKDPAPGYEQFETDDMFISNQDEDRPREEVRLIGMRTFDQVHAEVNRWDEREDSTMFGKPLEYRITLGDQEVETQNASKGVRQRTVYVHWSRIIHVADMLTNSEFIGTAACRPIANTLMDLQKIYAASGEGYWRAAFPGLSFESHPQLGGRVNMDKQAIKDQMHKYQHTMQRYLATTGGSVKTVSGTVTDPSSQIDKLVEAICIYLGCPVRIFKGSERGELASSQDKDSWDERMILRQASYITPSIIVPFVDRLIAVGVLPVPEQGYTVTWPDLTALSKALKAELAARLTDSMAKYVNGGVSAMISPKDYLVEFWDIPEEKADEMLANTEEFNSDEDNLFGASQGDQDAEERENAADSNEDEEEQEDEEEEDEDA